MNFATQKSCDMIVVTTLDEASLLFKKFNRQYPQSFNMSDTISDWNSCFVKIHHIMI